MNGHGKRVLGVYELAAQVEATFFTVDQHKDRIDRAKGELKVA
jgi:hypothetical protein